MSASSMFSAYITAADRLATGHAACEKQCPKREAYWKQKYQILYHAFDRITYHMDNDSTLEEEIRQEMQGVYDQYGGAVERIKELENKVPVLHTIIQTFVVFRERCSVRVKCVLRFCKNLFHKEAKL